MGGALILLVEKGAHVRFFASGTSKVVRFARAWLGPWKGCGSKPMVPFWGRCTTHFRTYFNVDWDVHWGCGLVTHGQMGPFPEKKTPRLTSLTPLVGRAAQATPGAHGIPPRHLFSGRAWLGGG